MEKVVRLGRVEAVQRYRRRGLRKALAVGLAAGEQRRDLGYAAKVVRELRWVGSWRGWNPAKVAAGQEWMDSRRPTGVAWRA